MSGRLLQAIRDRGLVFDGGIGSMLIARGLESGHAPEAWNRERPDDVGSVHVAYIEAGARVITTNTFGGTPPRLATLGLGEGALTLNADGLRLAHDAVAGAGVDAFVALSIGPTGLMQPPVGTATPDDIAHAFDAQMRAAAQAPTPDIVLIETMYDVREAVLALECAQAVFPGTPAAVTFALNSTPRGFFTMMGDEAAVATDRVRRCGAALTGANCAMSSSDMLPLAQALRAATDAPLLFQPNAGAPRVTEDGVVYDQRPEAFARDIRQLLDLGIDAVGGCCGTDPEFIRAVVASEHKGTTP